MGEPSDPWGRPITAYHVSAFLGRIRADRGIVYNVFATHGKYVLFDPINAEGSSYCCQFPVLRSRLPKAWRSALAHGQTNVPDVVAPTSGRSPLVTVSAEVWMEAYAALQREREKGTVG
jgi:hypothetical protein